MYVNILCSSRLIIDQWIFRRAEKKYIEKNKDERQKAVFFLIAINEKERERKKGGEKERTHTHTHTNISSSLFDFTHLC